MATKNVYLVYLINLTDKALVETLQGTPGVGGAIGAVIMAPDVAATTYSAVKLTTNLSAFIPPCLSSEWFTAGSDFPTNVKEFTRKSGGWFGISWLFGDTTHYYWRGKFTYAPPEVPTIEGVEVDAPETLQAARWTDGFELPTTGEGGTSNNHHSRAASRHCDGMGWSMLSHTELRSHNLNENFPALTSNKSWERFYMRPVRFPAAATTFWRSRGSVEGATGISLQLTPGGSIAVMQVSNVGAETLIASTGGLPLNVWQRIDLLIQFGLGATLRIVINGTQVLNVVGFAASGFATLNRVHISSEIGTTVANDAGIHFDDWTNKSYPLTVDGLDWLNGTKLQLISPTGFAPSNVWAGDFRTLLQNPRQGSADSITSVVPGGQLAVTTDAEACVDALVGARGIGSLVVCIYSSQGGASGNLGYSFNGVPTIAPIVESGGAGVWNHVYYQAGGLAEPPDITPLELIYQKGAGASPAFVQALFAVAEVIGLFGPEDVRDEGVGHPDPKPGPAGIHNAPYPRTPWASRTTKPAQQPVFKRTGTYVGNGVGIDIPFPVPPHWIWVRPLAGSSGGWLWFSSMIGPHFAGQQFVSAKMMVQACIDPTFVPVAGSTVPAAPADVDTAMQLASSMAYDPLPDGSDKHTDASAWALYLTDPTYFFRRMLGEMLVDGDPNEAQHGPFAIPPTDFINRQQQQAILRIEGASADSNAAGVSYAYMAFCDPAMRFCLNGALYNFVGAADIDTPLFDATFLANAGFLMREEIGATATTNIFLKGPGHAASTLSQLQSPETPAALQFSAGHIASKAAIHSNAFVSMAFSLFRTDDNSSDPNKARAVTITSYVGDGSATRTIGLLPPTGRRPMWAIITPHNAASVFRDPSHTGTTSTTFPNTANAATGIIAGGLDSIQVGIALNANGVGYEVLSFPGLAAPGNGGWSPPGDDWPVDPNPPTGPGPYDPEPPIDEPPVDEPDPGTPGIPDPLPPVGPMPGLTDDLATACKPDTQRIVNLALSRLGITLQIVDLATDLTIEAIIMRLVYKEAVEATLRDFPWPFTTRYVQLTRVGTTAPNSDWAYSYRQPNDCLFERRIVVARTGSIDPTEVPFKLSNDDTGGLIFTNQASAVLEYTSRPKCPHTRSEPLFREAVCWRLAGAAGPGLSRMPEKVAECLAEYQRQLDLAALIIPPGNPGEVPTLSAYDTTTPARIANLEAANWALVRIGAQTVRNLLTTDQSREAQAVRLIFEKELQATLRDFPWAFATVYASALPLVGGTAAVRLNNDWQYSYRLPADVIFVRRIVPATGRKWNRNPPMYRMGQDATGKLLYTDQPSTTVEPITIEYTTRPANCVQIADPLFTDAFSWRMASSLAPSLAQRDPEEIEHRGRGPRDKTEQKERPATGNQLRARAAVYAMQRYQDVLAKAKVSSANEQQQDLEPGDADWISGR
jgi:hypothetical protein